MIQVFFVDDHQSYRDAVAFMLSQQPDISVVGKAGTLGEARSMLGNVTVDIALIDLDLPDGSGLDILPELNRSSPEAWSIVLTGSKLKESHALSVAAGAAGYLHKSASIVDVISAIRRLAAGQSLMTSRETMQLLRDATDIRARAAAQMAMMKQLTPREREVLQALAEGKDNQAIADQLHLSTATVRSHVVQILRKLNVNTRLQAALLAVRAGMASDFPLTELST